MDDERRAQESWVTTWTLLLGILLVLAFLVPFVPPGWEAGEEIHWPIVEIFESDAPTSTILLWLLPVLLGVFAIIMAAVARVTVRGVLLFSAALVAIVVPRTYAGTWGIPLHSRFDFEFLPWMIFLMLGAAATIGAGNHLRRRHRVSVAPRLLAGIAGCILVLLFVLPIEDLDHSFIEQLLDGDEWEDEPMPQALLLGLFIYGVFGVLSFIPGRQGFIAGMLTVFSFLLPIAFPIALLAGTFRYEQELTLFELVQVGKHTTFFVGPFLLLAVGLAAWVSPLLPLSRRDAMGEEFGFDDDLDAFDEPGVPYPSTPLPPPLPPRPEAELEATLEGLVRLKEKGLLTDEEFETKRQQAVEKYEP